MAAAAVLAAAQIALGLYQTYKGYQASQEESPKMEIPQAATDAMNMAKVEAGKTEMPGQRMLQDKLASQAATASNRMLEASGGSGAALGGLAQINQGLSDQMGNIQMNQAAYSAQQRQNLIGQLGNMANWEQKQWQVNEWEPYQQSMESSRRLQDSGMQNIWGAATNYAQGQQTKNMWDNYTGLEQNKLDAQIKMNQDYMAAMKAQNQPRTVDGMPGGFAQNSPFEIPLQQPGQSVALNQSLPYELSTNWQSGMNIGIPQTGQTRMGGGIPNLQQPGQFMYPYQNQPHPLSYMSFGSK